MNTQRLAFDLLARLHDVAGPVEVTQVDLVKCEDNGKSVMAYFYDAADGCTALVFTTPRDFDPIALTLALEGVGTVH